MKQSNSNKSAKITVCCTDKEKELIKSKSKKLGTNTSDYIVSTCLSSNNAEIDSTVLEHFYSMQNSINRFKIGKYSRKRFLKQQEEDMNSLWQILNL